MSTVQHGDSTVQEVESTIGNARFSKGKWFCECHVAARCLTATKNSSHQGKKFWRCANVDNRQCSFFLWVVHEAAAKEWLKVSLPDSKFQSPTTLSRQGNPQAQTPKKTGNNDQDGSEIETPFTKAKRRRKVPADDSTCNGSRSANDQSGTGGDDPFQTSMAPESPSKALRTSLLSTPTQRFADKLKIDSTPLLVSNQDVISTKNAKQTAQELGPSPIFTRAKSMVIPVLEGESSLTTTVLSLIRSDNAELKPSTEIQIRHEIDLAVDISKAKVQRYEETISKLHGRVDELEQMILHLTE